MALAARPARGGGRASGRAGGARSDVSPVVAARAIAAELERYDWPTAGELTHDADFARAVGLVAGEPVASCACLWTIHPRS